MGVPPVRERRADGDDGAGIAFTHPAQRGHRAVHLTEVGDLGGACSSSGRISTIVENTVVIALLIHTSIGPSSATAVGTARA